jgi:hypothetical protein
MTRSNHPCQFSPEVLEIIEAAIQPPEHIHDPFAGPGLRLAALCDRIGVTFSGGDIEDWPGRDPRVGVLDATEPDSYPLGDGYVLVTSPVYVNKRCADYRNGPTPATKVKGRRDYGIALGGSLAPGNLARHTGRPREADAYWRLHAEAVKHWPSRVILNVDLPINSQWQMLLAEQGYEVNWMLPAFTRRYGGLDNADRRAGHEVVMFASR